MRAITTNKTDNLFLPIKGYNSSWFFDGISLNITCNGTIFSLFLPYSFKLKSNLLWTNGIIFWACIIFSGINKKLCSNRRLYLFVIRYRCKKERKTFSKDPHKRFWPCRMKVMAVICHRLKSDAYPAANSLGSSASQSWAWC